MGPVTLFIDRPLVLINNDENGIVPFVVVRDSFGARSAFERGGPVDRQYRRDGQRGFDRIGRPRGRLPASLWSTLSPRAVCRARFFQNSSPQRLRHDFQHAFAQLVRVQIFLAACFPIVDNRRHRRRRRLDDGILSAVNQSFSDYSVMADRYEIFLRHLLQQLIGKLK